MSERFFILDGPGFLFRAYHAIPFLSTSRGVPSHAVFGMSTMLWKLLREDTPDYFAVAWDPPGPDLPGGEVRRLQGDARPHARRSPEPDPVRQDALRGPAPAGARGAGLRGRRRARHRGRAHPRPADRAGAGHLRQGHAPAREPARARLLDHRPRRGPGDLRRGGGEGQVGRRARADPRHPGPHGRLHRQHPGRARGGGEDRGQADRPVRRRGASLREPLAGAGQAARDAGRQPQAGAALARAGHRQHAGADRGGSRDLPAPRAGLGPAARALDRARVPQPAAAGAGPARRRRWPAATWPRSPTRPRSGSTWCRSRRASRSPSRASATAGPPIRSSPRWASTTRRRGARCSCARGRT